MSITPGDVFVQLAPLSFDASTLEIWAPLLNGARVVVPPPEMNGLADIADSLTRHQVTTLWLTSGLFNAMVDEFPNALRNLKQLLAGGDVLSPTHVRRAMEAMESGCVINGYGPTENTTFTCCHRIREEDTLRATIPIGRPIRGTEVFILDEQMRPVSEQQKGELYIAGDGLARGYLHRPELTAERFVPNPFSSNAASRLYKSGDLAHYNAQGEIEFDGRTDLQVKIRGFRIEPREIEAVVHSIPGIAECAVTVKDANSDAKRLVCYFARQNDDCPRAAGLEQIVKEKLPAYMVPSAFVELERLPLNPNGKVDRRRLSDYQAERASVVMEAESAGAVEREVAAIFSALFHVDDVGAQDDFFELGGNSLMAARLFARIERQFGRKLPLATVLSARTPRSLAGVIAGDGWQPSWSPLVPLKTAGTLPPLFLVHAIGGNVVGYQDLVPYWRADQPLYALQARGLDEQTRPAASVEEMAADYLEAVRLKQPQGPYHLGGYSAGGVVAFAMACKLQEAGLEVGTLILIDSSIEGPVRNRLRSHPLHRECVRVSRTVRWNLAYMQRIGMRDFLSVKRRNFGMNVNIASQKLRRTLPFGLQNSGISALNVEESFIVALRNYVPGHFRGRAALLRTEDAEFYSPDETLGWSDVIDGAVSVHRIPGNHDNILSGSQVKILVDGILSEMDRAADEASAKIKSVRPL
jgi:thioesterase domain-containing protein/acyl carrier protein